MRPDCDYACIDHVTYMERHGQTDGYNDDVMKVVLKIMKIYIVFICFISPWPKTAKKRGLCTGVTDGRTDRLTYRRMDRWTDRPSQRDAFLIDAFQNSNSSLGVNDWLYAERLTDT